LKKLKLLVFLFILTGCANGRLDIIDANGEIVGECTAGYNWHPHGAKDSVDWLLNYCAQLALASDCDNCSVSDESILTKNYSFPEPPKGDSWNKRLARKEFKSGHISEQKYGYILAYIENIYYLENEAAKQQLDAGAINQTEYNQIIKKSKLDFYGE